MEKKVYIVLEEYASENGAIIKGVRHNFEDAKRLFAESRLKRLETMRGKWFDETYDITKPLWQSDMLFDAKDFKDSDTELRWIDSYGDQYSLTIEEEGVL